MRCTDSRLQGECVGYCFRAPDTTHTVGDLPEGLTGSSTHYSQRRFIPREGYEVGSAREKGRVEKAFPFTGFLSALGPLGGPPPPEAALSRLSSSSETCSKVAMFLPHEAPWGLSAQGFWGAGHLGTPPCTCQNSRLTEGKQVLGKHDIVNTNSRPRELPCQSGVEDSQAPRCPLGALHAGGTS